MHPNSLKNIEGNKIKPGEVRNPKGNAATLAMYRAAEKVLNLPAHALAEYVPENVAEEIEIAAAKGAINGDVAAHRELRQLTVGDKLNVNPDWEPEEWEMPEDDEPIPAPRWADPVSRKQG